MNCIFLYSWYESNHRILPWRETTDPYCIWVSEIILQQTRVNQGIDYYLRFISRFPDVRSLAEATEDEVLLYWQGLGYYSRARNLHKAAQQIVSTSGCPFRGKPTEGATIYNFLLSLPGVGEYTAGAIASFAYNLPYPAMDGNVYRVVARLMDCDIAFDTTAGKKHFRALIEQLLDRDNPRLFNSAMMELGALVCTPQSPDCEGCPLRDSCLALAHGTVSLLPVRKPRPSLRDRWFIYTMYIDGAGRTLIHQRQDKDIWQHLWEFPLQEVEQPSEAERDAFPLLHVLSHQRLHARVEIKKVSVLPSLPDTKVVACSELGDYAFPRLLERMLEVTNCIRPSLSFYGASTEHRIGDV